MANLANDELMSILTLDIVNVADVNQWYDLRSSAHLSTEGFILHRNE